MEQEKDILALIARGEPLRSVLERLILAVEAESKDGMHASVLLLDPEGKRLLHGAAPTLAEAYNAAIHGIEIGPNVGSCGTAAYLGHPVYVTDIAVDPLWDDFRELALEHGLRACWSTPIETADGQILGTFAIYHTTPRSPTPDELATINYVSHTAAIAIERHRWAEELREGRERLLAALKASRSGTFRWDIRTNELDCAGPAVRPYPRPNRA